MAHYFSSDFTLGILGGGQLGKMLLTETRKYDITTCVLDPSAEAPCRIGANVFTQGSLTDYNTVYNFGKAVDVLTIEIENVNVEALQQLQSEGVKVYPSPTTIKTIQNKATQKQFYAAHNIPTAPFKVFCNVENLKEAVVNNEVNIPFVWKAARFGYDGNGVKIVRKLTDLDTLPNEECIAETLVPFKKELAVIVARNPNGEITTYPVVEMEFHPEANQVEYVLCPARIPDEVAHKARTIALQVAEALQVVGLLAVELFQTQDDDILVNTDSKTAGVMVNLVGAEGYQGKVIYENIEQIMAMSGVTPHIYGKKETRPFRKMGHVTIINEDINQARAIAEKVKQTIKVIA